MASAMLGGAPAAMVTLRYDFPGGFLTTNEELIAQLGGKSAFRVGKAPMDVWRSRFHVTSQ